MPPRFHYDIQTAWQALSRPEGGVGWSFILMQQSPNLSYHAARYFPGNREGIIITFPKTIDGRGVSFPAGIGFEMQAEPDLFPESSEAVFSLTRTSEGSLDLFHTFVTDIVEALENSNALEAQLLFDVFIGRLRAWQEFMQHPPSKLLSVEEQTGLYGELIFIDSLLSYGLDPYQILTAWVGPLRGDQDFQLSSGAVEIKSTVSDDGFPAKIQSLAQLDDTIRQPLYIGATRLIVSPNGRSLPEMIEYLNAKFIDAGIGARFSTRTQQAGYHADQAPKYPRVLSVRDVRYLPVTTEFPRLVASSLNGALTSAKYGLDLDAVNIEPVTFETLAKNLLECQ